MFPKERIAVSSWTWHRAFHKGELSLVDIPAKAREAGISQVELNDFMLPPGRWSRTRKLLRGLFDNQDTNSKQARYRQSTFNDLIFELHKHDVQCISWTVESDLTVSEDLWLKELAYIIAGIEAATQLKANMVRLLIGGSDQMGANVDHLVTQRLKLISAICHQLFPAIQPVVENHWGLTSNIDRFLKLLEITPGIGICFDPGNTSRDNVEKAWGKLAAKAMLFHLKIYTLHPEKLDQDMAYQTIFQQLANAGYSGKLVIEYEGDEEAAETLQSVLKQLDTWVVGHYSENSTPPAIVTSAESDVQESVVAPAISFSKPA